MFEYLRSIFALYDNARVDLCDAVKEEPFDGKGSERKEKKKKDGQRAKEREGGEKRHRRDGRVEPQVSQDRVPYRSFQRTSLISSFLLLSPFVVAFPSLLSPFFLPLPLLPR